MFPQGYSIHVWIFQCSKGQPVSAVTTTSIIPFTFSSSKLSVKWRISANCLARACSLSRCCMGAYGGLVSASSRLRRAFSAKHTHARFYITNSSSPAGICIHHCYCTGFYVPAPSSCNSLWSVLDQKCLSCQQLEKGEVKLQQQDFNCTVATNRLKPLSFCHLLEGWRSKPVGVFSF